MNQTHSLQTGSLKYLITSCLGSIRLRQSEGTGRIPPHIRLLGLVSQLSRWNMERISARSAEGLSSELSIEDVHFLKAMIHAEIRKCSLKCPEVISDQLHFLAIGAIQIQSQTGSDKAWTLVSQSIQSFADSQKEKRTLLFGLATTALVICLSAVTISNTMMHPTHHSPADSPVAAAEGTTDPVTISTLLLAYNKMKSGTCQLPQAAMLPPEQRQAFLMFVNKGTIEVQHVENLRLALGYVNCLYPQELMHPVVSTGNRL